MDPTHSQSPTEYQPSPSVDRPQHLIAVGSPGVRIEPLLGILDTAGLGSQSTHSPSLEALVELNAEALEVRLQKDSEVHLLLFFRSPLPLLSEGMKQGRTPDDILSDWVQTTKALLAVIRRYRRRMTLIETTHASLHPTDFIQRLSQRLGLSLTCAAQAETRRLEDGDAMHLLIAQAAVQGNPHARQLASELQATALPIGSEDCLRPTAASAWAAFQECLERVEAKSEEQSDLKEENELLLLQLHQVQEELESYYLENRSFDRIHDKLQHEIETLKRELQEAKEEMWIHRRAAHYMRNSISWRITRPLRVLLGLVRGKRRG